jgi:hypothetical protein
MPLRMSALCHQGSEPETHGESPILVLCWYLDMVLCVYPSAGCPGPKKMLGTNVQLGSPIERVGQGQFRIPDMVFLSGVEHRI